jgi:NADPH:quinone reductase-like Zn-dependent oxidoreductase
MLDANEEARMTSTLVGNAAQSPAPSSMKAWRVHEFGPPEAMIFETVPRPDPGPGEVLVKVHAAGVGPWDGWIRAGRSALPQSLPLTLGSDLSGEVAALGSGISNMAVGDQVFGVTNTQFLGAYAQYAVASVGMIAARPLRLSDVEAASVPVVAVTAQQALFEQAKLVAGQTVLIHGAAGNVGAYAVQMARQAGLRVIGTADARDVEAVHGLGAQEVIDYRAVRFEDAVNSVDAVIDLVGGEVQARSFAVLRPGGILVSAVSKPDQEAATRHGVRALFFLVNVTTAHLTQIAAMINAGDLAVNVGTVLPLADARVAHEMLEGSRSRPRGKIVLSVGG